MNENDFADATLPPPGHSRAQNTTLEVNPPLSSVNISLSDMGNMHTVPHHRTLHRAQSADPSVMRRSHGNNLLRYSTGYDIFDETGKGNLTKRSARSGKIASGGDVLDYHSEKFTERKPFTPKTLKTNSKSKLVQFKYYNRPPTIKKERNPVIEEADEKDTRSIPSLGQTMRFSGGRRIPRMTTDSDIFNETLQSRAEQQVTPSGVPPLAISLDPDHINWLQEQSNKSASRRGHKSHVDDDPTEWEKADRQKIYTSMRKYEDDDLKTVPSGDTTLTMNRVDNDAG